MTPRQKPRMQESIAIGLGILLALFALVVIAGAGLAQSFGDCR